MDNILLKSAAAALCATAFSAASFHASAQDTVVIDNDFSGFRTVDIGSAFDFTLHKADECRVVISADERIADYLTYYIKDNTLNLALDSKSFPQELKKTFRGRDASVPVLQADIYVKDLKELRMHDSVVLNNEESFSTDSLHVSLDGRAMISGFSFEGDFLSVKLGRSSYADLSVKADSVRVAVSGASSADMTFETGGLSLHSEGMAGIRATGTAHRCAVYSESSSEVSVAGSAESLDVTGRGMSVINASGLEVDRAAVRLSGPSQCSADAGNSLCIDLSGGAHLMYGGTPSTHIVRIQNSSVTRYDDGN